MENNNLLKQNTEEENINNKNEDYISRYQYNNLRKHYELITDPTIKKCFPFFQKLKYNLTKSLSKNKTYIHEINTHEKALINYESFDLKNKILKIIIKETSNITYNYNINNPFVKIHFVDINTGCYLLKKDNNAYYQFENITKINSLGEKIIESSSYVLPIASNRCFDNKDVKTKFIFNDELILNIEMEEVLNENTLILFELLDANYKYLFNSDVDHNLNKDGLVKYAWGYLRVSSPYQIHLGESNINLFKYQFNSKKFEYNHIYDNIPEVYFDFIWPYKENMNAYLTIFLESIDLIPNVIVNNNPKNVFEIEKYELIEMNNNTNEISLNKKIINNNDTKEENETINNCIESFKINNNVCNIPNKNIIKIDYIYNQKGVSSLKFSNNGRFIACSFIIDFNYCDILLYDLELNKEFIVFKGHRDLVNSLEFNNNDSLLLSSSSDLTVKIWEITTYSPNYKYEDNTKMCYYFDFPVTQAIFAFNCNYFYSISSSNLSFYSITNNKPITNIILEENISCIEINESIFNLFCGDIKGSIFIYKISEDKPYLILINKISNPEIEGDIISKIHNLSITHSKILVQTRDNCIRMIKIEEAKIINRYFGSINKIGNIKFTISPDEQFLLSGSEEGEIYYWDIICGEKIENNSLNYKIKGWVNSVDWNKKYNIVAIGGIGGNFSVAIMGYTKTI